MKWIRTTKCGQWPKNNSNKKARRGLAQDSTSSTDWKMAKDSTTIKYALCTTNTVLRIWLTQPSPKNWLLDCTFQKYVTMYSQRSVELESQSKLRKAAVEQLPLKFFLKELQSASATETITISKPQKQGLWWTRVLLGLHPPSITHHKKKRFDKNHCNTYRKIYQQ